LPLLPFVDELIAAIATTSTSCTSGGGCTFVKKRVDSTDHLRKRKQAGTARSAGSEATGAATAPQARPVPNVEVGGSGGYGRMGLRPEAWPTAGNERRYRRRAGVR